MAVKAGDPDEPMNTDQVGDTLAETTQRLDAVRAHLQGIRDVLPSTPSRARRRILFADDLPLTRFLLARYLVQEMPHIEVLQATTGVEAVAMVEAHLPELVILDLRMPELDGWRAARRIRALPGGEHIAIIAMSVNATPGAEAHALRAGCDEFLAKPISDYAPMRARIEHWLRAGRRPPAAGTSALSA